MIKTKTMDVKIHNMDLHKQRGAKNIQICYGTLYRKDLISFTHNIMYIVTARITI
jgi:phenylalanyl-tRNA synthetase alpha subunit